MMEFLFGPVFSRRLGLSLGVNLFKENICSYDCVYCECGKTDILTTKRKEYASLDDIRSEINDYLSKNCLKLDHVTFSGRGEPTLYIYIDRILEEIKKFPVASALLTNSSLLYIREVRDKILGFDVIMPTISTVIDKEYKVIHRPQKEISLDKVLEGIKIFSDSYKGLFIPELMFIKGVNDSPSSVKSLIKYIKGLKYNACYLNTIIRPAAYSEYKGLDDDELQRIMNIMQQNGIRCISSDSPVSKGRVDYSDECLINTLNLRPISEEDIPNIFKDSVKAFSGIERLLKDKIIKKDKGFYRSL